jgi:uncharacterized protein YigA (DUF484 family)
MTSSQQPQHADDETIEASVVDYLSRNLRFFEQHPDLLAQLRIPHASGSAVSLLEHQVRVLRERNQNLQDRLDELLEVARDNDRLAERMHRLTLELMDATSVDGILFCLKDELRGSFDCDAVTVRLLGRGDPAQGWVELSMAERKLFSQVLKEPRPMCGRLPRDQLQFLFGDTATAIGSAALVPLADNGLIGLLAMGSYRTDRFHPGMGTVFLRQLGAGAGRALRRYL